ncbi:protein UL88 [Wood mouse herpesvirus]|uniref:Protein UL88 n=1 Tax=Wood mouse herpesvirus TaxID=432370 RepID=D0U1L3_9GAMA|nr:protein UL88 [Wood mouse herpesvirus]ACY41097.1 protein UL88 [Wood mouse herpesvirus]
MLRILKKDCAVTGGEVTLANQTKIFYVIKVPSLCSIVGSTSSGSVTSQDLFKTFPCGTPLSLPLVSTSNPLLSIVRLMVSPKPYDLTGVLCFGEDHETHYILRRGAKIITMTQEELDPICDIELHFTSNGALSSTRVPNRLSEDLFPGLVPIVHFPQNMILSRGFFTGGNGPIIKNVAQPYHLTSNYIVRVFSALKTPQVHAPGACQLYRGLQIMNQAHNGLDFFLNDSDINGMQQLFLKHVLLSRKGTDSCTLMFFQAYLPVAPEDIAQELIEKVELSLVKIELFATNAVFCMSTIATIVRPRVEVTTSANIKYIRMANKYFTMFPPMNKDAAVIFGAAVLDQICKETPIREIVLVLRKYAHVMRRPHTPTIKLYTVLTL